MKRSLIRVAALVATLGCVLVAGEAKAAFNSSFGFNGLGISTDTGDLAGAKLASNLAFGTNGSGTGVFSGLASLPLTSPAYFNSTTTTPGTPTAITLSVPPASTNVTNMPSPTGFNFTNATYGTFTQTEAAVLKAESFSITVPGFVTSVTYYVVGSFSGGVVGSATRASVTITFTQNAGPGQPLSSSGTLDIPNSVPEPASLALVGLGLAGILVVRRRLTA